MRPKERKLSTYQHLEIEVKLKIRNLQRLRVDLLGIGCEVTVPRSLERNWIWDFPGHPLRQKGELIRVRQFAGHGLLTFKGPAQQSKHFKIREERETEVQDAAILGVILQRIGLEAVFCYEKFRTSYSLKVRGQRHHLNLAVDETPIGNYLEIEGREIGIQWVASQLGFDTGAFIKESYLALFAKSELQKSQRHMIFTKAKTRSGTV
jgi:adenylate cyclase class 2